MDRQHTAQADLIDNLSDIALSDPGFAKISLKEKELQLQVLTEGNPELFRRVEDIILNAKKLLAGRSP